MLGTTDTPKSQIWVPKKFTLRKSSSVDIITWQDYIIESVALNSDISGMVFKETSKAFYPFPFFNVYIYII